MNKLTISIIAARFINQPAFSWWILGESAFRENIEFKLSKCQYFIYSSRNLCV